MFGRTVFWEAKMAGAPAHHAARTLSQGKDSALLPQACSQSSSSPLRCTCRPRLVPPWLQVLAESCKAAAENGGTAKTPQDIMMSYARSFMTSPVFKASWHWCTCTAMCSRTPPFSTAA